jgi:hypothetical protein
VGEAAARIAARVVAAGKLAAMRRLSTLSAAAGLGAVGALHAIWATGSAWPLRDKRQLTDSVSGRPGDDPPSPAACLGVAGLLAAAAGLVGGRPRRSPRVSRIGSAGVVATLTARGLLGLAGRTHVISPGSESQRFRRLDRRICSPLCLTLAALALPAVFGSVR